MLRRLLEASHRIQKSVHEREGEPRDLVEQAERMMFEVAHDTAAQDFALAHRDPRAGDDAPRGARPRASATSPARRPASATSTRSPAASSPGNLIILAARPSMGKSALVGNIAEIVAVEKGLPVAFFSLEMSETELAHRFLACRAGIPGDKLRKGQVEEPLAEGAEGVERARERADLDRHLLRPLDCSSCAPRPAASTRRRSGLGLVIVDYMQLMRADDPRPEPGRAGRRDLARPEAPRGRAERPGDLALSQLSRAPELRPGQAADPLGPSRVAETSSRTRTSSAFIFRQEYYEDDPDEDADRQGGADHRQAPQRADRRRRARVPRQYPRFRNMAQGYRERPRRRRGATARGTGDRRPGRPGR